MKRRAFVVRILCMLLAAMLLSGACLAEEATNRLVLTPKNEVGTYGGTLYAAFPTGYRGQAYQTLGFYEPILGWNDDLSEQVPNLVEAMEVSEDNMTYKFTIREGLKWSNGDPVTTADVLYQYEDVWQNEMLSTAPPTTYVVNGELCKLNVIDERTFELTFASPNLFLVYSLCLQGDTDSLFQPSNYLKQFNNKYVDEEELTKMAADEGYEDYVKLYSAKGSWLDNPECPTLYAWKLDSVSDDNLVRNFSRNPYYFKEDTAGNQLPYIDNVQVEYVDNSETLKLKVMSGEVDYIYAPTGETFTEWPTLAQNAEAGDYRLILASGDYPGIFDVMPNVSNQDPQKGQLLASKDFRVALSLAINRQEIIDLLVTVADFKGVPANYCVVEDSPYYNEKLATEYTEYDPDQANALLDELGLTARDDAGYRLGPDGQPLSFTLSIPTYNDLWVDGGMMIADYWKAVGLNVEAKALAPDIWNEMRTANELEMTILATGAGGMKVLNTNHVNAYACVAANWYTTWGIGFANYIVSNGENGVEPPQFVYDLNNLRDQVLTAGSLEEAGAKLGELLDCFAEAFPFMGICRPLPQFIVCTNRLKNTPENGDAWVTFTFGVGGNVNPCQFYIAD